MKRSVIQFAGKSLILSLPKAWTDAQHIRKGQELEVTPSGDKLIVTASAKRDKRELSLSEKDAPWFTADILSHIYQLGIDEVTVSCDAPAIAKSVREKASQLLGFEVVAETRGTITVKNVASPLEEEYTTLQRRAFYIVQEMGQILLQQATSPQEQRHAELEQLDIMVNKLTDFCKRSLNRHDAHSALFIGVQYSIVRDIEKIGDEYKKCAEHIKKAFPKGIRDILADINVFFILLHELTYGFTPELADRFHKQRAFLRRQQPRLFEAMKTHEEAMHLVNIITLIKDLFGPVYILHLSTRKDITAD